MAERQGQTLTVFVKAGNLPQVVEFGRLSWAVVALRGAAAKTVP